LSDKIKKDKIGCAFRTHEGEIHTKFKPENLKERD
jgi:hypothetical protein